MFTGKSCFSMNLRKQLFFHSLVSRRGTGQQGGLPMRKILAVFVLGIVMGTQPVSAGSDAYRIVDRIFDSVDRAQRLHHHQRYRRIYDGRRQYAHRRNRPHAHGPWCRHPKYDVRRRAMVYHHRRYERGYERCRYGNCREHDREYGGPVRTPSRPGHYTITIDVD